jgi:hypothetical protein
MQNGILSYYFLLVSKNIPDENRPKFRGRGFPYEQGIKELVAVQGFGRRVALEVPQYERRFLSGSSPKSFTPDTADITAGAILLVTVL